MPDHSGIVLVTDLDRTLLRQGGDTARSKISDVDLEAIERFKACGGIFTIATGRIRQAAEQFFDILKPNAPVILNNGGAVFDIEKNETVYAEYLDDAARYYTEALMERFPDMGVEVNLDDGIYAVRLTEWERRHLALTRMSFEERSLNEVPAEKWCKVLYSMAGGRLAELADFAASEGWDKADFVTSGEFLFECLPKGCSKGAALKRLTELVKWDSFTVAAAGDYDNDLEMLELADVAIAPANARDTVKNAADYVTSATCDEGAIAEAIGYLEKYCKA